MHIKINMKQESRHVSLLIVASLIIIIIIEIISGFVLHDHNEIIMQQQQQNQYFRKSISEMDSSNNNNNRRLMEEDEDEERVIEEVNNIINNRNNIITTIQNNDKIVKRTYGEGWNVWDKQSIIKGLYLKCSWTSYRTGGKSLPMCVHPEDDVISTSIRTYGFWNECNHMTNLWLNNNNQDKKNIFLDVGANIGACIMHFLIHTNAQIIAFEPHPRNLFCLTSTLSKLENQYQNRVILYPIGLGSSQSTSIIFGLKGNLGHSTISLNINEKRDAEHFHQPELIHIERLDSLLNSEELNGIALMKVDVEGFECNVLEGLGKDILNNNIHMIHTEVSLSDLKQYGCTGDEYIQKLKDANFHTSLFKSYGANTQTYIAANNRFKYNT